MPKYITTTADHNHCWSQQQEKRHWNEIGLITKIEHKIEILSQTYPRIAQRANNLFYIGVLTNKTVKNTKKNILEVPKTDKHLDESKNMNHGN